MPTIRDSARLAVEILGRALPACPLNRALAIDLAEGRHSPDDYYHSLLRLVFRLLCVSTAERRRYLPTGEATRLIRLARKREGAGDIGLFRRYRLCLGLEAPGAAELADRDFLAAVRALDIDADVDELVTVYESLLELKPAFDGGRFTLTEAPGAARKTGGSYFTPPALIDALLDTALDPLLNECRVDSEVLALKVCDPACGAGAFLVAAARRMGRKLADVRQQSDPRPATGEIVRRCLHGVDRDPVALELCRLALWSKGAIPGEQQLRCGDSLHAATFENWAGGFDVVLGNPPWERFKLQEKEWFAGRCPEIETAPTAAERRRRIAALADRDPALYRAYLQARQRAERERRHVKESGRYPLTARGDVNAYAPFVELGRRLLAPRGRLGFVVPSGVATDATLGPLFKDILDRRNLVSVFDFHNRRQLFPGVQGNQKFCLLTLTGGEAASFRVAAQLADPAELHDPARVYILSADDLARINPTTLHLPMFQTAQDAALVAAIHRRFPLLQARSASDGTVPSLALRACNEEASLNPWGISSGATLHMTADSGSFHTREQDGRAFLPLWEGKMIEAYNHRAATFEGVEEEGRYRTHAGARRTTLQERASRRFTPLPRYWVPEAEARRDGMGWRLVFRNAISAVADARSLVAVVLPGYPVGNSLQVIRLPDARRAALLLAVLNSFVLDYCLRQKASGGNLNWYILEQLPVPAPSAFDAPCRWEPGRSLGDWVMARVLELTYTANDLRAFVRECGHRGSPFPWDDERRCALRCELDAALFHLYGLDRDEVECVMETFPIVRKRDERDRGEYRTKWVILERFAAMAGAAEFRQPDAVTQIAPVAACGRALLSER